jgi:AraC-like DNA-binding protein
LQLSIKRGYFQTYEPKKTLPFCCYHQLFHYIFSDSALIKLNQIEYKLMTGEILYTQPGAIVEFMSKNRNIQTGMICLDFVYGPQLEYDFCDPAKLDPAIEIESDYTFNDNIRIPTVIKSGNDEKMRNIVNSICSFDLKDENELCTHRFGLYLFMSKILQYSRQKYGSKINSEKYHELITKANSFIESNFSLSDLTLADIAIASGKFNPICFGQIYRKETGKTLIENLVTRRIHHAQLLLKINRNMPIKEVSYDSVFKSPKYFMRVFKKLTGKTPKQYRKEIY